MIMGAVLTYPGSVDNYSELRANNLRTEHAVAYSEAYSADEQAKLAVEQGLAAGNDSIQDAEVVPFPAALQRSVRDFYQGAVQQTNSSREVYQSLLMRENATTGTTEANVQLAEIKIGANAKSSDEREERSVFFDPTVLAQRVKESRDFLTGKIAVGGSFDVIE
ncbi:MAG: hypothetical protein IJ833_01175 [Lachnospiraceae bacterium]|nr:hypothetical protein [Lachnospiraceae bacterium]